MKIKKIVSRTMKSDHFGNIAEDIFVIVVLFVSCAFIVLYNDLCAPVHFQKGAWNVIFDTIVYMRFRLCC
jgi:hypothetical protein